MEVDNVSYDIFEWFPVLYCQDVFKYLEAKDVLEASLVNKEWNKFCDERQQTKKLKLVFKRSNECSLSADVSDVIRNSKRRYQHVEFINLKADDWKLIMPFLANTTGWWKSVQLKACEYIDEETFPVFLGIIEPSIESLRFNVKLCPVEVVAADPRWTFPCLKLLKVDYCEYNIFKYFVRCSSVVKFRFCFPDDPTDPFMTEYRDAMRQDVRTILNNCHGLKEVATSDDNLLLVDPSQFSFKLREIKILMMCWSLDTGMVYSFLRTHAATLETLALNETFNQECLQLILGMPRLSSLSIDFNYICDAMSTWRGEFPVNRSITSLEVTQPMFAGHQNLFAILIKALTYLKHFKCVVMTEELLLALSQAAPNLESLHCKRFNVSRLPEADIFPNMKVFKGGLIFKGLQETTVQSNFAALVRKEM